MPLLAKYSPLGEGGKKSEQSTSQIVLPINLSFDFKKIALFTESKILGAFDNSQNIVLPN